jgi:hypothetical protein
MRKIHEVLRLHYEQKLGQRQIARSASVSRGNEVTVTSFPPV